MNRDAEPGALDDIAEELEAIEQRSPFARTLITVVVTLVVVGLVIGALVAISVMMRETRTATSTVDLRGAPQLSLRAASADVRIVPTDGEEVTVTADVTSGLVETSYELRRRGDEVEIVSECQSWLSPKCGVVVTVGVPRGLPLVVATGAGDAEARDLAGVLTIGSDSGDVSTSGLEVDELTVKTGSGDVDAEFARDPFAVKASSTSGDIELRLPGEEEFSVDVRSDSGRITGDLEGAEDAERFVRVRSGSGDVVLRRG